MVTIVRSGARRLAGSALLQRAPAAGALLQPTQASGVDALRRRFLATRFMSSTNQLLDEIQEKEEQLYDQIAVLENFVHAGVNNRRMLRSLSAQIEPRPDDPQWCFMRRAKTISDVIRPVGIVSGLVLGFGSVFVLFCLQETSAAIVKERQEKEKEAARV